MELLQPKIIHVLNKAEDTVRIQVLPNNDITISIYGKGGDTAKCGNAKQLTVVARKFNLTQKLVLQLIQD